MLKEILNCIEKVYRNKYGWKLIPCSDIEFLYVDIQKYRGKEKKLKDGTLILPEDIVGEIHINNNNMPEISLRNLKWFDQKINQELTYLAKALEFDDFKKCKAFYGRTILHPFVQRYGFEVSPINGKGRQFLISLWDHILYNVYTNRKKSKYRTTMEVWISREELNKIKKHV
ncbi:MAG: hypothetical protein ABRQ27_17040 [Clostridiaceae bacterium]